MTVEAEDLLGRTVAHDNRNYIVRHWSGALSLGQSYWVNGVLIGLPFNIYFRMISYFPLETPAEFFVWRIVPFLLFVPVAIWQWVGIWRSAGHSMQEGNWGWASVARLMVAIGFVVLPLSLVAVARSAWSIGVAYVEQNSAVYNVSLSGNIVTFSGKITPDSADRLQELLDKKTVDRLVIRQSVGGFVRPALRVAHAIQSKKMTVVAISDCSSICVAFLAAGARRFVLPETIIRLHTATIVGTGDKIEDVDKAAADEEKKLYVDVGAGPDFLAKKQAHHGLFDFYEPTLDDLIKNGLVTDVYDRQISNYLPARVWCDANPDECRRTARENRAARGMKT